MSKNKIKITSAKGRPMLTWVGKKPLDYIKGFPTQLVEVFDPLNKGRIIEIPTYDELKDNWQNLLFHGDNKDVLAALIELGYRGKIDLIYIDPPFKSGADYLRKVELRGLKNLGRIEEDEASILQQTMYFDIWNNDTYLQFMYERLLLMKELLAETGSIYLHLDYRMAHYIKLLMDEVFGEENFQNEFIWLYSGREMNTSKWNPKHHNILLYTKSDNWIFNYEEVAEEPSAEVKKQYKHTDEEGRRYVIRSEEGSKGLSKEGPGTYRQYYKPVPPRDYKYFSYIASSDEHQGFSTQKPGSLIRHLMKASSKKNGIVLDAFLGSGTTARVAQKLCRRWIGCDINKGGIHLTSRELQKIISEQIKKKETNYPSFAIYKVNDYDLNLLQTEAIELAVQHIGIQRTKTDRFFDGTLGKNLVKIIDFNHPLTLLDLQLLQDEQKKRPDEDRNIAIVCLGKELAVDPWIEEWNKKHPINKIKVIELRTDEKYGSFLVHKPTEAKVKIKRKDSKAIIEIKNFISPTIIERLNIDNKLFKVKIPDFRSMIDCVLIDADFDGKIFHIVYSDVPEKKQDLVKGKYEIEIPKEKAKVAVKIIDMLGEEVLFVEEL